MGLGIAMDQLENQGVALRDNATNAVHQLVDPSSRYAALGQLTYDTGVVAATALLTKGVGMGVGAAAARAGQFGIFTDRVIQVEDAMNFASRDLLENHFTKHGVEFNNAFQTADEYLSGAHDVIKNGINVTYDYKGEIRIGYVRFMGTTEGKSILNGIHNFGVAKFEFVGTNNEGNITTYFTPSGKIFGM